MPLPSYRARLTTRIVTLSTVSLILVLAMIGGTLWLSWQLQGAGAAINDAGSLRMRANAVAIALLQRDALPVSALQSQVDQMNATLDRLRDGDPARPLFLPSDGDVRSQFDAVSRAWHSRLEPDVRAGMAADQEAVARYLDELPEFVRGADTLVALIEHENASKTAWLRTSQMALAAMACVGTLAIVYLLYLWIVMPVQQLREGLKRIRRRQFDARLPVTTLDEFGQLAAGFNRMAAELQTVYADLEGAVEAKTAELEAQNRELTALYEMAAFLNQPNDVEALCRGFLARLTRQFAADGAVVRLISEDKHAYLIGSEGLPAGLLDDQRCIAATDCACSDTPCCKDEGFASVASFGIVSQGERLGAFSLHFKAERIVPSSEAHLLETLGAHFGTALKSRRLAALARQLAVSEERNLVAQGLHDSIAQSLNFLKMQVHLLDRATRDERMSEIREIVPLLQGGVAASYDDVRELLINFRTKLGSGELRRAVNESIERFAVQTGIRPELDYRDEGGLPLPPDQQLQVLFILQEALSNIRKHAEARRVNVTIVNNRDFTLLVEDDGQGYDPEEMAALGETHVGFHIMRERADRLGASLRLTGAPARGARVELVLPATARQAA